MCNRLREGIPVKSSFARVLATVALFACLSTPTLLAAKEKPPQNWDGLELKKTKGLDLVYVRPGVDFPPYKTVKLTNVSVEFQKNWARDTRDFSRRPTPDDLQRIRDKVSELMHEVFLEELVKHGYPVVDTAGEDTMVVETAIIDLYINAPDTQSPGITRSYTSSSAVHAWKSRRCCSSSKRPKLAERKPELSTLRLRHFNDAAAESCMGRCVASCVRGDRGYERVRLAFEPERTHFFDAASEAAI